MAFIAAGKHRGKTVFTLFGAALAGEGRASIGIRRSGGRGVRKPEQADRDGLWPPGWGDLDIHHRLPGRLVGLAASLRPMPAACSRVFYDPSVERATDSIQLQTFRQGNFRQPIEFCRIAGGNWRPGKR